MMLITTGTIALQVLVLSLHHHPPNKHPPAWIRRCLKSLRWNSKLYSTAAAGNIHPLNNANPTEISVTVSNNETVSPCTHDKKDTSPSGKENTEAIQNEWRNLAADLDSLFFWLCFAVLLLCYVVILGIMPFTQTEPSIEKEDQKIRYGSAALEQYVRHGY